MADAETKTEHRKEKKKAQSHYDPYNLNVPVVIVTSEVAPYSKTEPGGFGDVFVHSFEVLSKKPKTRQKIQRPKSLNFIFRNPHYWNSS